VRSSRPFVRSTLLALTGLTLVALGSFAGLAHARGEAPAHRQVVFVRLETPSVGLAGLYDIVGCGAACTSYVPHLYAKTVDHAWHEITPPHMLSQLEGVVFLTPLIGWVAANDCAAGKAFVYRTTDGGRTWRFAPVHSANCSAGSRLELSFSDNRHGWVISIAENGNRSPLARTTDGGKSWHEIAASAPLNGAIVFATSKDGWVSRSDFSVAQQLYVTRDSGRTWRRRIMVVPPSWSGARLFPDAPRFFGKRGVLPVDLVRGARTAVAFYTTGDSGRTWQLRTVRPVTFSISASSFAHHVPTSITSPSTWWVASGGEHPAIAVTSDAGTSWRESTAPVSPVTISTGDVHVAWLTTGGAAAAVYETRDGGRTWHRLALPS
jgi:photosystem II stability/assembly factor-like uncharacterized protein